MIDVHQNAALSESFEGDRSRVIGNRCNSQIGSPEVTVSCSISFLRIKLLTFEQFD